MTRVGICLDTYGNHGGVHQYSMALLKALTSLPKDRYEVIGICITDEWNRYCAEHAIQHFYTERIVRKDNAVRFMASYIKNRLCRTDLLECHERNIDIVFFPSVTPTSICVKNPICAIHDLMHRYLRQYPEIASVYQYVLREVLFSRIAHHSKVILVDSNLGKKHVEECYFRKKTVNKITVLPYIAPDYIYHVEQYKDDEWQEIRQHLPLKYFFYPAQFWKHKNHLNLVKAIDNLKTKYPDIHIVFVGSEKNAYREIVEYVRNAQLENNITFLGYVSDYSMVQLYKNTQALIMPSFFGPTNIPQLEAFYLGCPVAVADVFAIKEQVKDAALLFKPDSVPEIVNCMEQLWCDDNLRKQLVDKGYQWSAEWGPEQFRNKVLEILEQYVE